MALDTHGQQQNLIKPPHVAIVPTPGIGHLTPLVELAKLLLFHHNFTITFIIPNDGLHLAPQKKLLEALDPQAISYIFLPPVSFDDLPDDVMVETKIALTLTRSLSALRVSLTELTESTRLVALVVDLFGADAFDVANELHVSPYIFFPSSALGLSLIFHFPHLHETTTCEYRDLPEPVQLPGCVPLHGRDFMDPVQDRSNEAYKVMVRMCKKHRSAAGIMVNSFVDLEPGAFKAFKEQGQGLPPVYPVGPVIKISSADGFEGNECLRWLDKQPNESVLFVSFGSGGTFSQEQMTELALGLELSGQRFIWVVKSPNETAKNANYFNVQGIEDPSGFLPHGFLERTKEVGLVVPSWAPQVQVLSHQSTGGFLTHCGWNSTLESIVHGVPLIAWPLYAEQRMNRVLLVDGLKVALGVKLNDKGIVESQDIAKYVRGLIEGDEGKLLRNKMKGYKEAAKLALSQEGSSTKSLAEVAQMKELALGLEMSGQRFLWVVRSPNETAKNGTYFTSSSTAQQKDPLGFLPDGFLERTKEVGLVVPSWAPQVHVLSHESTGGFLTHCGWNSTLESIVNGVPLIAWPLYAEQYINAVLLADDIKIAWRVEMNDKGIVEGQDIARYARGLIEGDEGRLLRNKMKELKEAAKVALSQGGSSTESLAEVAEIWKGHN